MNKEYKNIVALSLVFAGYVILAFFTNPMIAAGAVALVGGMRLLDFTVPSKNNYNE